jgi:ABC-2 type transport system permease protein
MHDAWTIAAKDARELWRDGRFRTASLLLLTILSASLITGWTHAASTSRLRSQAQAAEQELSRDKGEMNPHAAAHYGAFVFKPVEPLTAIDPGVDPYVGVTVFLEAHQQQLARHSDLEDATPVRRLGELSAAASLQVLVPLLIVTLTFSAFAGERESGTLRHVASLGLSRWALGLGKLLGTALPLMTVLAPATVIGVLAMVSTSPASVAGDGALRAAMLVVTYLVYFAFWTMTGLVVSAWARAANTALIVLLAVWFGTCFVAPPVASAIARAQQPAPSSAELAIAIQRARAALPLWTERVADVEERFLAGELPAGEGLPSNPEVLALIESEHDESALYDAIFDELWDDYDSQAKAYERLGAIVPTLAVQSLSMGMSGTDYSLYRRFLEATSDYRREFLQKLNVELAEYAEVDTFEYTRGREFWATIPEFSFATPGVAWSLEQRRASVISLGGWALAALLGLGLSIGRMRAG